MDGIGKQQPNINAQGIRGADKSAPSPGGPNQQFKDSYNIYTQAGIYALLSARLRSQMSQTGPTQSEVEQQVKNMQVQVEQQVKEMQEAMEQSSHYEDPLYGINPGRIRRTARRLTRNHPELAQQISDQVKQRKKDSAIHNALASATDDRGARPMKDPRVRNSAIQVAKDLISLKASLTEANTLDLKDLMTAVNKLRDHLEY